jgi:predicted phosphoribosyltransferase
MARWENHFSPANMTTRQQNLRRLMQDRLEDSERNGFLTSCGASTGESIMTFSDRREAGRKLAEELTEYANTNALVLALPRGGVETGYEVARALDAELDVIVTRKLGAPGNPEFGFGAIGPGDVRVLNEETVRRLGLSKEQIEDVAEREGKELNRRLEEYRGKRELPQIEGRTVILVDDGMATGGTALAGVQTVRAQDPGTLILAVPVAPPDTAEKLRGKVDELVCLHTPRAFMAVGQWYQNFDQTTDEQVVDLLKKAREEGEGE